MKAVMYGAGNIGRGFIGALFSLSGYQVTFIDVSKPVVEALHTRGSYPVRVLTGEGYEDMLVHPVDAVDGTNTSEVVKTIAEADIMATAVGAKVLKIIAPNIAAGLKERFANGAKPLNILICENLIDANRVLEGLLLEHLTSAEQAWFSENVGLVEASIGRMVPIQTLEMQDGDPLRVCVERYGYLPVDRDAFRGEIPQISQMVPFSPFDFYIRRKLYVHNLGHAVAAYLGLYAGRERIADAIDDPDICLLTQGAMLESAEALSARYGVPMSELLLHIQDLLGRFTNRSLGDTCARVGADPARKLASHDRLIGPARLCLEQSVAPAYLCVGAAGAVYEYLKENGREQTNRNAAAALRELSAIDDGEPILDGILGYYALLVKGENVAEVRRAAQKAKATASSGVI
ncbi:MAG: mannitol dehydrogenase [Eubacteriales bacterium]|nr:mannitol dehydrogenase [Eubacteriales bacterium]